MAESKGKNKFLEDPKYSGVRDAIKSIANDTINERIEETKRQKGKGDDDDDSINIFDSIFGGLSDSEDSD